MEKIYDKTHQYASLFPKEHSTKQTLLCIYD